jgi:hypothetical protein
VHKHCKRDESSSTKVEGEISRSNEEIMTRVTERNGKGLQNKKAREDARERGGGAKKIEYKL